METTESTLMSHFYKSCNHRFNARTHLNTESARRILFKDFGGKKAMKVLDRKEKMKINVDVVKDQLDKTLSGQFLTQLALPLHMMKSVAYERIQFDQDQMSIEFLIVSHYLIK